MMAACARGLRLPAGLILGLTIFLLTAAGPVGAGPGDGSYQQSIAVLLDFNLDSLLAGGQLQGAFVVQNKNPLRNGPITVPDPTTTILTDPGNFVILLQKRVNREWFLVQVDDCVFDLPSLDLPDDAFRRVEFQCRAGRFVDPGVKSVRVTAIVPLDGRLYLSRLSQSLGSRRARSEPPATQAPSPSKAPAENVRVTNND